MIWFETVANMAGLTLALLSNAEEPSRCTPEAPAVMLVYRETEERDGSARLRITTVCALPAPREEPASFATGEV